jgi:hypothetical protein
MLKVGSSIHITHSFKVSDYSTAESVKSKDSPPNSPDLDLLDYGIWNEHKLLVHNNRGEPFSVPGITAAKK